MVHFFITDDVSVKKYVRDTFSNLPNTKVSETELSNGSNIIYNDQRASYIQLNDAEVWGFGTFFNENGFHASALESIRDLDDLLDLLRHRLRGHYVFVVSSKSGVRVIPDKIGLLNVFYSDSDKSYISTDPVTVSICASNTTPSEQEVKEFILNESTVGDKTIFSGTKRLSFGEEVKLTDENLSTGSVHTYSIDNLSFKDHISRISNYFEQIDTFDGSIAADISAGFDTRTVAAIGHTTIEDLAGNTNPNPNDGGADETLSPKIADKLSLPLEVIGFEENYKGNDQYMIHGTTLGRDIIRSSQLPKRLEKKYDYFDFILGGYGGETLRAKYNDISIPEYYNANQSEELFSDTEYEQKILSKINNYPDTYTNGQLMNLVYTIDRMRIWGGSLITMSSMYGDVLHPFLDWYLINPVFSLSPKQLKNGKYQQKIIEHFAPSLKNFPINTTSQFDYQYEKIKKRLKNNIKKSDRLLTIAKKAHSLTGSTVDKQLHPVAESKGLDNIDENLFADLNIDINVLQNSENVKKISRAHSISAFQNYIEKESVQANR